MGFFRTVALMVISYIAVKTLKRALKTVEAQQAKAKVQDPKDMGPMKRLKLDPVTGAYVPEA